MLKKQISLINATNLIGLFFLLPLTDSVAINFQPETFEHLSHFKLKEEKWRSVADKQDNIKITVEYPEMKIIETKKDTKKLAVTLNFRVIQTP